MSTSPTLGKSTPASLQEVIGTNHGYDGNNLCASEADVILVNMQSNYSPLTMEQAEVYSR